MNIGKSNATSFKKGHARIPGAGRKPGTPNRTTQQLKDAILEAADRLGYIREEPKLDDKGKPTGEIELVHDGKDATVGYLMWLGKHNPASFAALLARVLPIQLNQKQKQDESDPMESSNHRMRFVSTTFLAKIGQSAHHLAPPRGREGRAALGREHEWRWRLLVAFEPAQRPKLDAAQWVDRWRAVLGAAHVDLPRAKSMVFARPHLGIADPFGRSAVWLDCPGHQLVDG
jgi:hypothetical protein